MLSLNAESRKSLISKKLFWTALAIMYVALLLIINFDQVGDWHFILGLLGCVGSIFIIKDFVLKEAMALSIYRLEYPKHKAPRLFCLVVAIAMLILFPFYKS
tara:strand:- start:3497 stop:3802 length:306 start_codon:yes stop_codon:yes gene_type:complete